MDTYPPRPDAEARQAGTATVIARTREWVENAVIGLNLCPFARPFSEGRIRYASPTRGRGTRCSPTLRRAAALRRGPAGGGRDDPPDPPAGPPEFPDYNDFLRGRGWSAASGCGRDPGRRLPPGYRFAGTPPDAAENYTNRSPHPMLHLLRESSVERAVEAAGEEVAAIGERNMETLRRLGFEGWRRLWLAKSGEGRATGAPAAANDSRS